MSGTVIGVDVGGTFTDVVLRPVDAAPISAKVLTTPEDPVHGIRRGIAQVLEASGRSASTISEVVHGTTLATNTVLQRTGARVLLVTTDGFADLLTLGRSARVEEERFDLRHGSVDAEIGPVAMSEVAERIDAAGRVVIPLDVDAAAARVVADAERCDAESIAVCLLQSWADPTHERALGAALRRVRPDLPVSLSSEVWPELREHDRAMTTFLAAYLAPSMTSYLGRLTDTLRSMGIAAPLWVMDSAGGLVTPEVAAARPVLTVESGGSAGVRAVADLSESLGIARAIAFDMGGTTAKVAVVDDGRMHITHEFQLGGRGSFGVPRAGTGLPVKGPVVDLCEISAGGGSMAWVDAGKSLHVGPRSAGAVPGPAAYGLGGTATTVTDANVVLGVLAEGVLSDAVTIDTGRASAAVEADVARPLDLTVGAAAHAVRAIAVAKMAAAIRMVTVQRGIDPRGMPIVATGGAGPMHAADVAAQFGITTVVIPALAGVASAVGLTAARPAAERVRSIVLDAVEAELPRITAVIDELRRACELEVTDVGRTVSAVVDMRVRGQAHSIPVELDASASLTMATVAERFATSYRRAYGIEPIGPAEFLTCRVRVAAPARPPSPPASLPAAASLPRRRPLRVTAADIVEADVWTWSELPADTTLPGPALVEGNGTTVHVPGGWTASLDAAGNLVLRSSAPVRSA